MALQVGLHANAVTHPSQSFRREWMAARASQWPRGIGPASYADGMLDLDPIDIEAIAAALADQTDYEHRWLIDPRTGEVVFWTTDTGIDGENPVEIDELDLTVIDPLPSYVWHQDIVDFADGNSDRAAGQRLSQALQGKGAFRRFKHQVYDHHPGAVFGLARADVMPGPACGPSSGWRTKDSLRTAPLNGSPVTTGEPHLP